MSKLAFITGTIVALPAAAYFYVAHNIPVFRDVVPTCMEAFANLLPVERAATCTCFAEQVATPYWTVRELVLPATRVEGLKQAAANTCRALSFERSIGDQRPTRMSPMQRTTK